MRLELEKSTGGTKRGLVLGGFFGRVEEAGLGQFASPFGGFVALAQHLLQGLKENELQVEMQQDDDDERRYRA